MESAGDESTDAAEVEQKLLSLRKGQSKLKVRYSSEGALISLRLAGLPDSRC